MIEAYRGQRNVIVVRQAGDTGETTVEAALSAPRVDVWWGGRTDNASLMLALGWLLASAPGWEDSLLRINTVVSDIKDRDEAERRIDEMIQQGRLSAERQVHLKPAGADVFVTIRAASEGAALVFLGVRAPEPEEAAKDYAVYYASLIKHTDGLPATALVLAAEDLDFRRLFD